MASTAAQIGSTSRPIYCGSAISGYLRPIGKLDLLAFGLSKFSDNPGYPFTPAMIAKDGSQYAHCGCHTKEQALHFMDEYCYGCDAVFTFILEGDQVLEGYYIDMID